MVNITILERINQLIAGVENAPARRMKKWSERARIGTNGRSWYLTNLIVKIKELLTLVSGGDVVEMLKDVLTTEELDLLAPQEYTKAIQNLVNIKMFVTIITVSYINFLLF
jgi:hypothetical protein